MSYSKLYILTELSANDVKFISVDRQKLDLSYGTVNSIFVEIQPDFMNTKMTLVYTLLYVQLIARIPFHLGKEVNTSSTLSQHF